MNQLLIEAFNTWPYWQVKHSSSVPTYLYELTSGLTNTSHLVRMGERYYVIRLNAQEGSALAINRLHERRIVEKLSLHKLSSHKLCPNIVYPEVHAMEKEQRFTVFEYIDGRTWSDHDFADVKNQQRLMQTIEMYQQLVVDIPEFDYLRCVKSYWEAIAQRHITLHADVAAAFVAFCQHVDLFLKNSYTPVLSHHDLVPSNIMETQQGLVILDWEYAGMGHPDFDSIYIKKYKEGSVDMQEPAIDLENINAKSPIEQLIDWLNYLWLILR